MEGLLSPGLPRLVVEKLQFDCVGFFHGSQQEREGGGNLSQHGDNRSVIKSVIERVTVGQILSH